MCATSAQIVDDVVPAVPMRQWVVTVPFELRFALATNARVMSAVLRLAMEEIQRSYVKRAKARGLVDPRIGAISFIHRFGGSLNLNVHFHIMLIDGVYTEEGSHFEPLEPPTPDEVRVVVERIYKRVARWARRQGARFCSNDASEASGLESAGVQRGLFATIDERGRPIVDDLASERRFDPRKESAMAASHEGFTVHAGVAIAAWDRDGRERLLRYGARPPFSLERISILVDGRVAYRTKYPGPHGHTHRVMSPVDFLARIASTIPNPPSHYDWSETRTRTRDGDGHHAGAPSLRRRPPGCSLHTGPREWPQARRGSAPTPPQRAARSAT